MIMSVCLASAGIVSVIYSVYTGVFWDLMEEEVENFNLGPENGAGSE